MKKLLYLLILYICLWASSCSQSSHHRQILSEAERIVSLYPDSALNMLEEIDPTDLKADSLKALYGVLIASAHKAGDFSMVPDSLTKYAFEYYKGRNFKSYLQAGDLYALHLFWTGAGETALSLLDSLISIPQMPESSRVELLRSRITVGGLLSDWKRNIVAIRQLMQIDTVETFRSEYKHQLYLNYSFVGKNDSALILLDELIEDARRKNFGEKEFEYKYEKIGMLEESGRYAESNQLADYIIENAPEASIMPFVLFWKALNFLNMGDFQAANQQLKIADRYTKDMTQEEYRYYEGFAGHIRNLLKFQTEQRIQIVPLAELSNSQRDRWFRDENTHHLQKQSTLKAENRALLFKAQSERKTYIIVIGSLVALIIVGGGIWLLQKHKRKIVEAEEHAETLQRMVDELQKPSAPTDNQEALRRAMLQQLNIIKMVAETPTEQNREMLRKISSVDNNADGPLINWDNVYEIVDNLHYGFYTKLQERYGDTISEKEVQAIVLLAAGFSAKEISVIISQSAASVYVRKSSVKKKLGVPEKEDVIAFLRQELSC